MSAQLLKDYVLSSGGSAWDQGLTSGCGRIEPAAQLQAVTVIDVNVVSGYVRKIAGQTLKAEHLGLLIERQVGGHEVEARSYRLLRV